MKRYLAVAVLGLSLALGGCANIQRAVEVTSQAELTPQSAYVAVNTFNGLEVIATGYLRLPRCDGARSVCRDPGATKAIVGAVREGRIARDKIERSARTGRVSGFETLNIAISTLQAIYAQYRIGS